MQAKLKFTFLTVGCAIMLLLLVGATSLDEPKEETITGVVTVFDWDENENPKQLAISVTTYIENKDEEEEEFTEIVEDYIVGNSEKGKELFGLIGEMVEATGTVTADKEGLKTLVVSAFKIIEEDPEK